MDKLVHHQMGEGDDVQTGQEFGQPLVVASLAVGAGRHSEGALDHPRRGGRKAQPSLASANCTTSSWLPCAAAVAGLYSAAEPASTYTNVTPTPLTSCH